MEVTSQPGFMLMGITVSYKKGGKKIRDLPMVYTEQETANQIFIDVYKFNDA